MLASKRQSREKGVFRLPFILLEKTLFALLALGYTLRYTLYVLKPSAVGVISPIKRAINSFLETLGRKEKDMQTWKEFLMENYGLDAEGYERLSIYEKNIINAEYDEMVKHFIGR